MYATLALCVSTGSMTAYKPYTAEPLITGTLDQLMSSYVEHGAAQHQECSLWC